MTETQAIRIIANHVKAPFLGTEGKRNQWYRFGGSLLSEGRLFSLAQSILNESH